MDVAETILGIPATDWDMAMGRTTNSVRNLSLQPIE